ncbi:hypothetical protein GGR20_001385 [Devosia subaequoris]|uniref:DUF2924 domain-containing protein n=1 Tax=Devosia subaequoris TaxID=395930 RepID=A0A7W6ILF7_9HYPH|nr:DUF2924 domain-containing protein [Devosia subaequoris]MBB4051743.1 hypothetical protein [Devosia subaequoris]MCP1210902.1 DUF2924 domain-containing protein [Devosia subaequoris]
MEQIQTDYQSRSGAEAVTAGPSHSPTLEQAGSPSFEDERKEGLRHDLAQLAELDINGLRVLWRKRLRTGPPDLPRSLLMRLLAYRLQAKVHGDLDRATQRYLERIQRENIRERQEGTRKAKAPPTVPPVRRRRLGPGTLLVREFGNDVHTVTVTTAGFIWQGAEYQSLSDIARRITGTRWNGPRFFGLREKDTSNGAAGEGK